MLNCKCSFFRFEEVALRHLQPVRTDPRDRRHEDAQDARTGVRGLQGDLFGDQRHALHAGLPLLRQAHEDRILQGGLGHHRQDEGNLPGRMEHVMFLGLKLIFNLCGQRMQLILL